VIWALLTLLLLLPAGTAKAAPGDPYVVYTANRNPEGTAAAVVLRTDPATGALTEISRNGPQGNLFVHPYDLAVEHDGSLVIADMGELNQKDGSVIRVDPLTGRQSLVSSGGEFFDPSGIAVGPNGVLYVLDNLAPDNDGGVIRVDPRTGAQSVLTRGGSLDLPFGIAFGADGHLVVANRVSANPLTQCLLGGGRIVRVNVNTGAQTVLANTPLNLAGLLSFPLGIAVAADGTVMTANECPGTGGIVLADPISGLLNTLTSNSASDALVTPQRIAFDPAGDLLVSDYALGDNADGGIVRVNRVDGAQSVVRSGDLFNHPLGIATVVNRGPSAALNLSPRTVAAGRPVVLDAGGSSDPEGLRLLYEWDLDGNGSFEAGSGWNPVVTRTFSQDGHALVRVRVNDPHGGRSVAAGMVRVDGSLPQLSRLRAGARVLGVGRGTKRARRRAPRSTLVRFMLSEPAQVSLSVERRRTGRRRGGGPCRPKARRGRRCVVWSRQRVIERAADTGTNAIRLRARGLKPGRFRLVVSAVDEVGNRSVTRQLGVRVVRLRR
jgi:sugar lactone lactonase YvrE